MLCWHSGIQRIGRHICSDNNAGSDNTSVSEVHISDDRRSRIHGYIVSNRGNPPIASPKGHSLVKRAILTNATCIEIHAVPMCNQKSWTKGRIRRGVYAILELLTPHDQPSERKQPWHSRSP